MATISKDQPVAIVYYRYDPDEKQTHHNHPYVHNGDFFVHNGVAVKDLTPGTPKEPVQVRHVATWPNTDQLTICDENADRIKAWVSGKHPDYHQSKAVSGTKVTDEKERLWVCIDIIAYSSANPPPPPGRRPVAYMLDNNTKEPNNALLRGLALLSNGELAIHYWHAVNSTAAAAGQDGRTAKDPKAFQVQEGTHAGKTELAVKYE